MEFQDVVDRRRMVRNFEAGRPVPADVLDRVLANALHAPSAGFSQGWAFLVLDSPADVERFWSVTWADGDRSSFRWQGLFDAPVLIVPSEYTPIGCIALGYGAPDEPSPSLKRGRRPVADVVHRGRFRAAPR